MTQKIELENSELISSGLPCKCGSSDAVAYYEDEDGGHHSKCFSCSEFIRNPQPEQLAFDPENLSSFKGGITKSSGWSAQNKQQRNNMDEEKVYEDLTKEYEEGIFRNLKARGLSENTCKVYGVRTVEKGLNGFPAHYFPNYHRESGNLIVTKIRGVKEKAPGSYIRDFAVRKAYPTAVKHSGLFGQKAFPAGSAKFITITSGEYDAMAVYEMTGEKYPCVSIPNGDDNALKAIKDNWKYLETFKNIVLAFDNDPSGEKAVNNIVEHFKDARFKILRLPKRIDGVDEDIKDPSDYKLKGGKNFTDLWWKAEAYVPQDLVLSSSLKDRIKARKNVECFEFPWEGLNKVTYGMRKGEISLIKARRGVGKTQVIREIMYYILDNYPEEKIGGLFIEETPDVTGEGIMSLAANKRLHLPDAQYTDEEWEQAFDKVLKNDRMIFYDGFGMNDADSVLDAVEWMYHQTGAQFMFLDSLTLMTTSHSSDERKKLDMIASRLKDLRLKHNLHICAVVHENREGEVRGSDGPENMANVVASLSRDQKNLDEVIRNTTEVLVEKNRFNGDTGPACSLLYKSETGRLIERDPELLPGDHDPDFDPVVDPEIKVEDLE